MSSTPKPDRVEEQGKDSPVASGAGGKEGLDPLPTPGDQALRLSEFEIYATPDNQGSKLAFVVGIYHGKCGYSVALPKSFLNVAVELAHKHLKFCAAHD